MRLGVLFSGGKDSCLAMLKAMKDNEIKALISVISENKESYMFHVPNIELTRLQAEAMGVPLISKKTKGVKEDELEDLRDVIIEAKEKYDIEGIVTGAVESVYQATRIQKICDELNLWCFNPLWKKDQVELIKEMLEKDIKAIVSGVFAYPLDEKLLGKVIDEDLLNQFIENLEKYRISPAGEGGEIETTVLSAPFFRKEIIIKDYEIKMDNNSGVYIIKNAVLN